MKVSSSAPLDENSIGLSAREKTRCAGSSVGTISPCGIDIFIGCLFDGTRNHRLNSLRRGDFTQSNISRLFDVFDRCVSPGTGVRRIQLSCTECIWWLRMRCVARSRWIWWMARTASRSSTPTCVVDEGAFE